MSKKMVKVVLIAALNAAIIIALIFMNRSSSVPTAKVQEVTFPCDSNLDHNFINFPRGGPYSLAELQAGIPFGYKIFLNNPETTVVIPDQCWPQIPRDKMLFMSINTDSMERFNVNDLFIATVKR